MLVSEALTKLKASLDAPPQEPKFEGLVAGRGDTEVSGIATCFAPSVRTLRRAVDEGCNLVIADAHPFYTYTPDWGAANVRSIVDESPVGRAKQEFIDDNEIAIVRLPSALAARHPAMAATALAKSCGFGALRARDAESDFVLADIPATEFDVLARSLSGRNVSHGMRLIGRPDLSVRCIAVGTGLLSPAALGRMLTEPEVDAVVGGEVVEWEGGPYFEDVIAAGRDAGLLLTGLAASREPLAGALANWARDTITGTPVVEIADQDPVWTVPNGADA